MMAATVEQERLLVLMPTTRDAERTVAGLSAANFHCEVCADLVALCAEIKRGAGAALLTEEAMLHDRDQRIPAALRDEPSWSNFPLIVLAQPGHKAGHLPAAQMLNVTLVERPVRFLTLRSVVEAALRHRRHQYQIRDTVLQLTRARHELERANQELEQRVRERTQKLQETISELEAFSYSVSHDLRAPLRSMEGYATALMEDQGDKLDTSGKLYLSKISAAAARLDLLVQDVLAYSRVAKGEIHLQDVNLSRLMQEAVETYPQFRQNGSIAIQEPLPVVRAHPAYLMQCISNLLGNALKFVRPGVPPAVVIRAEEEPDAENVKVWFEDNGIGIAPEHFQQIFQIFGRVHSNNHFEGTGIGLAIVRKAAERMGGALGVTSELGKGSRFWLSLKKASGSLETNPAG
jgi:signal transduction histidine kinase